MGILTLGSVSRMDLVRKHATLIAATAGVAVVVVVWAKRKR